MGIQIRYRDYFLLVCFGDYVIGVYVFFIGFGQFINIGDYQIFSVFVQIKFCVQFFGYWCDSQVKYVFFGWFFRCYRLGCWYSGFGFFVVIQGYQKCLGFVIVQNDYVNGFVDSCVVNGVDQVVYVFNISVVKSQDYVIRFDICIFCRIVWYICDYCVCGGFKIFDSVDYIFGYILNMNIQLVVMGFVEFLQLIDYIGYDVGCYREVDID